LHIFEHPFAQLLKIVGRDHRDLKICLFRIHENILLKRILEQIKDAFFPSQNGAVTSPTSRGQGVTAHANQPNLDPCSET